MSLMPVGFPAMSSTGYHLPFVRSMSWLTVSTVALMALQSLGVRAEAVGGDSWEEAACSLACAPLPGEAQDVPEKVCVQACIQGKLVDKVKDAAKKVAEVAGPAGKAVVKVGGPTLECLALCGSPSTLAGQLVSTASSEFFAHGWLRALAMTGLKLGCAVPAQVGAFTGWGPVGTSTCMALCGALKLIN